MRDRNAADARVVRPEQVAQIEQNRRVSLNEDRLFHLYLHSRQLHIHRQWGIGDVCQGKEAPGVVPVTEPEPLVFEGIRGIAQTANLGRERSLTGTLVRRKHKGNGIVQASHKVQHRDCGIDRALPTIRITDAGAAVTGQVLADKLRRASDRIVDVHR